MRLFYSAASPYARIVRIALLETGLGGRVTEQEITRAQLYSPDSEVLPFNPIGRVPTLELDDGTILTESKLILDYLDVISPGPPLLPRDGSDGWRTLAEMGQAWGLLDSIVTWLRASRQSEPKRVAAIVAGETIRANRAADERVAAIVAGETIRANRAADALEVAVANGAYGGSLDATQIVLGAGLGMIEPMLRLWTWREGRPGLSAWYDAIAARPSFQLTEPPSR